MSSAGAALVFPGQRWASVHGGGRTVVKVLSITEEKLKPPVACIMPVEFVVVEVEEALRTHKGKVFEERRLNFGTDWWRLQKSSEHFETAGDAQAACIDGWAYKCRKCATYGATRVRRIDGRIPTQESIFFCPQHRDEWNKLLDDQYEDRRILLDGSVY